MDLEGLYYQSRSKLQVVLSILWVYLNPMGYTSILLVMVYLNPMGKTFLPLGLVKYLSSWKVILCSSSLYCIFNHSSSNYHILFVVDVHRFITDMQALGLDIDPEKGKSDICSNIVGWKLRKGHSNLWPFFYSVC